MVLERCVYGNVFPTSRNDTRPANIARLASVKENEATFLDEFITEECPSLLEVCTSKIAILDFGVMVLQLYLIVYRFGGGEGGRNLSIVIIVLSQVLNNNLVPDFARYYHPATIMSLPPNSKSCMKPWSSYTCLQ